MQRVHETVAASVVDLAVAGAREQLEQRHAETQPARRDADVQTLVDEYVLPRVAQDVAEQQAATDAARFELAATNALSEAARHLPDASS